MKTHQAGNRGEVHETVEVQGHIIDSLILPKILDCITGSGGDFRIVQVSIGQTRTDPSHASIEVSAPSQETLDGILGIIADHGAVSVSADDCQMAGADCAGAFPEGFYSTTNQRTDVRLDGDWIQVEPQEMDCGIAVDVRDRTAVCVPMSDVCVGQLFVVGHAGVRVHPQERHAQTRGFEFMNSQVSTEKPKGVATAQVAQEMARCRREGEKILVVAGPAVVHTGSGAHLCQLIRSGYVQHLFSGNALAAHDIEQAMFGTSLGVKLESGDIVEAGHEHHYLRAINRIRRLGGIRPAIARQELTRGIMSVVSQRLDGRRP